MTSLPFAFHALNLVLPLRDLSDFAVNHSSSEEHDKSVALPQTKYLFIH